MDIEKLKRIAKEREEAHKHHPSSRPLSPKYEFIGIVGEAQFSEEFNLPLDETLRLGGDAGKDFDSILGTIDVKAAILAYNLIVEEGHVNADIYVLARFYEDFEAATLLGWAYKAEVLQAPKKTFGKHKVIDHYIPVRNLRRMDELKVLLGVHKPFSTLDAPRKEQKTEPVSASPKQMPWD